MKSESERLGRTEEEVFIHLAIGEGLVGPAPKTELVEDTKQDQLAYHVGRRAIENIVAKSGCAEYTELPLAQRDTVALAVGRTLVNFAETSVGMRKSADLVEVSQRMDRFLEKRPTAMPQTGALKQKPMAIEQNKQREHLLRLQVRGHADIGKKTAQELQEAMSQRDQILRQLLKVNNEDLIKQVLKPELLNVSHRQDTLNKYITAPSLQGPELRSQTEMIAAPIRSEGSTRPMMPVYDVFMAHDKTPVRDASSRVPRDAILAIQKKML